MKIRLIARKPQKRKDICYDVCKYPKPRFFLCSNLHGIVKIPNHNDVGGQEENKRSDLNRIFLPLELSIAQETL